MHLDSTTRKLQLLLSAVITTNQLPIVVGWVDITSSSVTGGASVNNSNSVTAVDIVAAPAASTTRKINYLSVYNADTVVTTVVIRYNDNGTNYNEVVRAINPGETLQYTDKNGWSVLPAPVPGRLIRTVIINQGTTSHTVTNNCNSIKVYLQAAGGAGGGGATAAVSAALGGGGSAGGYAEKTFTVTPGTSYTCAVGTGGTAGAAGNNAGNAGGNTTFQVGAVTVTAFGGLGGAGMAAGTSVLSALGGASPAVSTNGDVNAGGQPGRVGQRGSGTAGTSGAGGSCLSGPGGNASNTQATGNTATVGFGGGGAGGACINGGGNVAGGAGANGVLIVEEYT